MNIKRRLIYSASFFFVFLSCSLSLFCLNKKNAITFETRTRFGDNTVAYIKAKLLALRYDLELYYKPFIYSNNLTLHLQEKIYDPKLEKQFKHKKNITSENNITKNNTAPILYSSSLFTYLPFISNNSISHSSNPAVSILNDLSTNINDICEYTLQNLEFAQEIKKMLQPISPPSSPRLPKDRITIAVHIRKGGGFDLPLYSEQFFRYSKNLVPQEKPIGRFQDILNPFKFPPTQFYIDQLKMLSSILNDIPLYVFIFTDDNNSKKLCAIFKKECNHHNIIFDCREHNNYHNQNVIEDLWTMAQFDCLIRSWSHFAGIAQLLGNHKLIIYPLSQFWSNHKLIVNKVFIVIRNIYNNEISTLILPDDGQEKVKVAIKKQMP